MRYIPNIITSFNLASGFLSLVFTARGDIITASWLILAAMIFDFLDGFSARLLKAYSEIGKEFDSLSDIVSFSVAPALIIYNLVSTSLTSSVSSTVSGNLQIITAIMLFFPVIMPVCAALRLAKFNLDPAQVTSFRGLPTPANALAVISIVIAANYSDSPLLNSFISSPLSLNIFTLVLSLLMVSRIPMLSLKIKNFRLKGNEGRYLLAGLVAISFLVLGMVAAPLIIPFYLMASLLSLLF
jgi:CDP-diacylglycerol--serine O-phosphatidyltransferase